LAESAPTLFHQLPNEEPTIHYLEDLQLCSFEMQVTGLKHLGFGVAYRIDSAALQLLHQQLGQHFQESLIPQDRQPFRPHVVIQNKVTPEASKQLMAELTDSFEPFTVRAIGLDLWIYLDGHWRHGFGYNFIK
jgi:2'-5' RNA ligase